MESLTLYDLISAVCPLDGANVGDPNDPKTWTLIYASAATSEQRQSAQTLFATLTPDSALPPPPPQPDNIIAGTTNARYLNRFLYVTLLPLLSLY